MSQSWLIASGKGGVGKSMVTAALGVALARKSMHCCCVDADLGLRDLDTEWDSYLSELNDAGLEQYIEDMNRYYAN